MSAYVLFQIEVTDAALYENYKEAAPASVALYGGRYLSRGGSSEALQGVWEAERTTIIEFSSAAAARTWHDSKEYAPARAIRDKAASVNVIVIEGLVDYFDPEDFDEEE